MISRTFFFFFCCSPSSLHKLQLSSHSTRPPSLHFPSHSFLVVPLGAVRDAVAHERRRDEEHGPGRRRRRRRRRGRRRCRRRLPFASPVSPSDSAREPRPRRGGASRRPGLVGAVGAVAVVVVDGGARDREGGSSSAPRRSRRPSSPPAHSAPACGLALPRSSSYSADERLGAAEFADRGREHAPGAGDLALPLVGRRQRRRRRRRRRSRRRFRFRSRFRRRRRRQFLVSSRQDVRDSNASVAPRRYRDEDKDAQGEEQRLVAPDGGPRWSKFLG